MMSIIGQVPIVNDEVEINHVKFKIEKMTGRGVANVSMSASKGQIEYVERMNP